MIMANIEEAVGIASKMYRCRKSAKFLFGDEYKSKVQPYITGLRSVMERNDINELKAVLEFTKDPEIANNEMAVIMLMSAALEISES